MFGATIQAAATLLLGAALAAYVALRPARPGLRGRLLAVLAALAAWSGGVIWRFTASGDGAAFHGFLLGWLGIVSLPPLWLLLAAHYARTPILEQHPRLALAAGVPSLLCWLSLATNESHHLFLRSFSQETVTRGPLFFAWLFVAYPFVLSGIGLFLVGARRSFLRGAWLRSVLVGVVALLPTTSSMLFVFGFLPVRYDPTPAALGVSVLILTFGIFRLQLIDAIPFARRDVVDHLRDGVLIAAPDGAVLDANPAAVAILGQPLAALRGRPLTALLVELGGGSPAVQALVAGLERLEPDAALPAVELAVPPERHLEVTAKCLATFDGDALGRFVVLRERTDERRYERLLRQSQRLETVGSLAAGVAHEVNNPLAFVRANLVQIQRLAAWLAKPGTDADPADVGEELEELPQLVSECLDGIDRIGRIVDAMRRFSRLPGEDLGPVDLNRTVQEAIRLADLHHNRNVTVEAWLAERLPPVRGSAQRLTQVFLNLLVNAKQALGSREGRITMRTRRAGGLVELMMSDDGPGVPEAIRDRIFDPFFTTKGPDEGTGLGLAIAYDIVREHGGVLELRPGPAGGACFLVHLPIADETDALAAPRVGDA